MSTHSNHLLAPWQQWIRTLETLQALLVSPAPDMDTIVGLAQKLENDRSYLPPPETIDAQSPLWPWREEITKLLQQGFELNAQVLGALQTIQRGLLTEQAQEQAKGQQLRRTLGAYQAQSTTDGQPRFIDRHR